MTYHKWKEVTSWKIKEKKGKEKKGKVKLLYFSKTIIFKVIKAVIYKTNYLSSLVCLSESNLWDL